MRLNVSAQGLRTIDQTTATVRTLDARTNAYRAFNAARDAILARPPRRRDFSNMLRTTGDSFVLIGCRTSKILVDSVAACDLNFSRSTNKRAIASQYEISMCQMPGVD
jgi:hypothetical protein